MGQAPTRLDFFRVKFAILTLIEHRNQSSYHQSNGSSQKRNCTILDIRKDLGILFRSFRRSFISGPRLVKRRHSSAAHHKHSTMEPVLLRLPRLDPPEDEPKFVLVHVSSAGRRPLDLKLIGTENSTEFAVSCKVATRSTAARLAHGIQFHALVNSGANQISVI